MNDEQFQKRVGLSLNSIIEATNERKLMIVGMCVLIAVAFFMGKFIGGEQTKASECKIFFDNAVYSIPYNLTTFDYKQFQNNDSYRQLFQEGNP